MVLFLFQAAKCAIKVDLVKDNFSELKGTIAGPPDTPYEGGTFHLDIKVPETYPFNPPKIKFITKIWHPNISSVTGAICLDILKDQWWVFLLSLALRGCYTLPVIIIVCKEKNSC